MDLEIINCFPHNVISFRGPLWSGCSLLVGLWAYSLFLDRKLNNWSSLFSYFVNSFEWMLSCLWIIINEIILIILFLCFFEGFKSMLIVIFQWWLMWQIFQNIAIFSWRSIGAETSYLKITFLVFLFFRK